MTSELARLLLQAEEGLGPITDNDPLRNAVAPLADRVRGPIETVRDAFTLQRDEQGIPVPTHPLQMGMTALMALGAGRPTVAPNSMAKKPYGIYNAPERAPHPEIVDYPHGTPSDAAGRITKTFTGDDVRARYLVGRQVVGGEKVALPPAEYDALTEALTGTKSAALTPREMGSDLGRILINRSSGRPEQIFLRDNLPADKVGMVHAHELGHAVSQRIGPTPYRGMQLKGSAETDALKANYNTLNNPNRASGGLEAAPWGPKWRPKDSRYPPHQVLPELEAEAFRAALTNPNYMSVQHPELYRRMAEVVNKDPWLSKILQLNSLAGGAAIPLATMSGRGNDGT